MNLENIETIVFQGYKLFSIDISIFDCSNYYGKIVQKLNGIRMSVAGILAH